MNRKMFILFVVLSLACLTSCGKNKVKTTEAEMNSTTTVLETTEAYEYGVGENPFGDAWEQTETVDADQATDSNTNVLPTPTRPAGAPMTEYEKYQSMSAEEQMEYMNSFESVDAFFAWYNSAKEEYEAQIPVIEVGDGPIDMSEFFG